LGKRSSSTAHLFQELEEIMQNICENNA